MSEKKWSRGPWSTGGTSNPGSPDARQNVWGPTPKGMQSGELIARDIRIPNARLIAAALDLYEAASLACLMFERKNVSTAESDWLGDDEHEAWSALQKAMAKARGEAA